MACSGGAVCMCVFKHPYSLLHDSFSTPGPISAKSDILTVVSKTLNL